MWDVKIRDANKTKHDSLVEHIARLIDDGKLKPGEMLPTQREISTKLKVSIGTVIKAFTELTKRGYVFGEVGRGTFVSDYKYLSSNVQSELINLGNFESPDFTTLAAFRALQSGISEVTLDSELYFKMGYIEPSGSLSHKQAMVEWLKWCGLTADTNQVIICGSAQHATFLAIEVLCKPGEALMVEELTMLNIRDICSLAGVKMVPIKMDEDGIVPESFESQCRASKSRVLYTIPFLHNPTCAVQPLKRRQELVRIAAKYDVTFIEDGVNNALGEDRIKPLAALYPDHTVFVTSLSKAISPGVRVGGIYARQNLIEKLEFANRATLWMNSPLLNEIATNLIRSGKAKVMVAGKRQAIRERQRVVAKVLKGLEYATHPEAFHVWLKLPSQWNSADFAEELLKQKVLVRSSDMFYVGGGTPPNCIRIGIGSPHTLEELTTGLTRIVEVSKRRPEKIKGF